MFLTCIFLMPAPYSIDLRKKTIEAYEAGEGSQAAIAARFKICTMTFKRYWKRYKETGGIETHSHHAGRKPSVHGKKEEQRLLKIVEKHPDATLAELCDLYNANKACKKAVIPMVMHRTLVRLGIKRKKKSHYAIEQDRPDIQTKRQKFKKKK